MPDPYALVEKMRGFDDPYGLLASSIIIAAHSDLTCRGFPKRGGVCVTHDDLFPDCLTCQLDAIEFFLGGEASNLADHFCQDSDWIPRAVNKIIEERFGGLAEGMEITEEQLHDLLVDGIRWLALQNEETSLALARTLKKIIVTAMDGRREEEKSALTEERVSNG